MVKKKTVVKFSDIPLKDFHNQTLCLNKNDPKWNDLSKEQKELSQIWQQDLVLKNQIYLLNTLNI